MAEPADLRIDIVEGIISNFKADVIVNSTNIDLYLNTGAISKAILKGAGKRIQDECYKNYPQGIELGKVAVTDGYKLPCKKVYHGALPTWDSKENNVDPKELLCEFICACLERAHDDGATSIAFPTLGCGFLNYPYKEVAKTASNCIAIFKGLHEDTCLQTIYIVVYTKGQDWRHMKLAFMQELGCARVEPEQRGRLARADSFSVAKLGAAKMGILGKRVLRSHVRDEQAKKRKIDSQEPQASSSTDEPDYPLSLQSEQDHEFQTEQAFDSCKKTLPCGHACPGVKDEKSCPPCIQNDCPGLGALKQTADDDCLICYTDALSAAPIIQLACDHMYHHHCVIRMLDNKWVGPRITFNFMNCPMCKKGMEHSLLDEKLEPFNALRDDVRRKALMRLNYEELDKCDDVTSHDSPYFEKPQEFAMDRYCYYPCFKCEQAYFGGVVQCEDGAAEREFEDKDLICPACLNPDPKQKCDDHGDDNLEYKCRYCCSIAVFYCHGTTHYCNTCHNNWCRITNTPVNKLPKCPAGPDLKQLKGECPLNVKHPPTGTEFALGCGICKNTQFF